MNGKLIVKFDFVNEEGISIMPKSAVNGFCTKMIKENISREDCMLINMKLMNSVSHLIPAVSEYHLFPRIPDKIAKEVDNNIGEEFAPQWPSFSFLSNE